MASLTPGPDCPAYTLADRAAGPGGWSGLAEGIGLAQDYPGQASDQSRADQWLALWLTGQQGVAGGEGKAEYGDLR